MPLNFKTIKQYMMEVKIKKIDSTNLKAVSHFIAILDGKSAHVTGANGKGKSTVIRALTDRLRGLKPDIITKIGEAEGVTTIELTDGCKFVWEYNDKGQDKLSYFAPNTFKPARRDVFKSMCSQYFPNQFDINKFLTTTEPRKRLDMISQLINVDLSEVQAKYKGVAEVRKDAKKALKLLKDQIMPKPDIKTFKNITEFCKKENALISEIAEDISGKKEEITEQRKGLNDLYVTNKESNEEKEKAHKEAYQEKLDEWITVNTNREVMIDNFNEEQKEYKSVISNSKALITDVSAICSGTFFDNFIGYFAANKFVDNMTQPKEFIVYESTERPEFTKLELPDPMPSAKGLNELEADLNELEGDIKLANEQLKVKESELSEIKAAKQVYDLQLKQYAKHRENITEHYDYAQECEAEVVKVLNEIKAIVKAAKLPDEFMIDLTNKNDILFRVTPDVEHLPITNETLASSAIFIAAFKLQANYLTAFRVAHFDVSYLDFENRKKVLDEAISMGIQLITESPAMSQSEMELKCVVTED